MAGEGCVRSEGAGKEFQIRVDCRELNAREVLFQVVPHCLKARTEGERAVIVVENLDLLSDSVTRLLKAFDRLSDDFPAQITLADSSGLGSAFLTALSRRSRLNC